jgi:hypothetical protein
MSGTNVRRERMTRARPRAGHVLLVACVALLLLGGLVPSGARAAPPLAVGVVDFYALSAPRSPEAATGVVPQQFAATDLSEMLAAASPGRFTIIPRATVVRAERAMGWVPADALHPNRLRALASRLRADRLVVGQINTLALDAPAPAESYPPPGNTVTTGLAVVVVRVFDPVQGRDVARIGGSAQAMSTLPSLVEEQALHEALARTVAGLTIDLTTRVPPPPAPPPVPVVHLH